MASKQKIALVVSPQNWGRMYISKHHYSIELAKLGYSVYFLEPPTETKIFSFPKIKIENSEIKNLKIVKSTLFFSYYFKFHVPFLHNFLIKLHRNILLKKIGTPEIIFSFDLTNNFPFKGLNGKKIFFAADEPILKRNLKSAEGADKIVSVSQHILDIYQNTYPDIEKILIDHGVSDDFFQNHSSSSKKYEGINIGLSGNFMFSDIDYKCLRKIISDNSSLNFHFYGPNTIEESNIGADFSLNYQEFYNFIKDSNNVTLHGVLAKRNLAIELNLMDAFLICYRPENSQSSGSNSHKILEYLSTGKLIISTNFTRYVNTDLFEMYDSRSNENFSNYFKQKISEIGIYNSHELISKRKKYASDFQYSNQLFKILKN